jgi:hypothetical protein
LNSICFESTFGKTASASASLVFSSNLFTRTSYRVTVTTRNNWYPVQGSEVALYFPFPLYTAPTKFFTRRFLLSDPLPDQHPVSLISRYHRAVSDFTTRRRLPWPKYVSQLPTEGLTTKLDSAAMITWFKAAVKDAKIRHDEKVTAHSHRSGSATAAFKVGVPVPVFGQVADWDLSGKICFKTYYRSQLDCTPVLLRRLFADLFQ